MSRKKVGKNTEKGKKDSKNKANKKAKNADYEVGYGCPPKHFQFKKGQSGNPKGRPKGPTTFPDSFNYELSKDVKVVMDGRERKITGLSAISKKYKNMILSGDYKFMKMFMDKNAKDVDIGPYINPEHIKEAEIDPYEGLRAPLELPTAPRRAAFIEVQNLLKEAMRRKFANGETADDNNLKE